MPQVTASDLERLLSRHDPLGLADAGIPAGSYLPEAELAAPRLSRARSVSDVRRVLANAFTGCLGAAFVPSRESLTLPSQELWAALRAS